MCEKKSPCWFLFLMHLLTMFIPASKQPLKFNAPKVSCFAVTSKYSLQTLMLSFTYETLGNSVCSGSKSIRFGREV
jgi:hypothetical protein